MGEGEEEEGGWMARWMGRRGRRGEAVVVFGEGGVEGGRVVVMDEAGSRYVNLFLSFFSLSLVG